MAKDCVVLDLRLPDMSGMDVLEQLKGDPELSDVPVVVFTGRQMSAEEDAELHTMARSIVAPQQLPVGVITALIGVPLFLLQLNQHRRMGAK